MRNFLFERLAMASAAMAKKSEAAVKCRVTSLDDTELVGNTIIETIGSPVYVNEDNISGHADFRITDTGWYIFARVSAPDGVTVGDGFEITGAAGSIAPTAGDTSVDIAVKFEVAAESKKVMVNWGAAVDVFVFKSTDLAVRNMDYRVTFYQYDLEPYCTWTWQAATGTFAANQSYYTKEGDVYTKAEVTTGEAIPADTYYIHSALMISGFVRNISYMLDEIDCPVTINLPSTDTDYGAWFEVQTYFPAAKSITLTAVAPDKVSGKLVHSPKAGVNIINLMYHRPTKTWLPTLTQFETGV